MKPLVGKNLLKFKMCLEKADKHLAEAEKLAFGAYGSHMITSDIRTARVLTNPSGNLCSLSIGSLIAPMTRKVARMTKGVNQ